MCTIQNRADEPPLHLFTNEEIDHVLLAIYASSITLHNLDVRTYLKIARKLSEGVFDGFGATMDTVQYASEDYYMLKALRNNTYFFSAAKTYQQTREMTDLLVKDGELVSWPDFHKSAKDVFLRYNEDYLKTEYNSAIAQARSASQWQEIQADKTALPMLVYHTVGDGRVRPTHQTLNNIARPVEDKFWDKYYPPNGWNCRCTVLQDNETPTTNLQGFKAPDDVPPIFRFNAGKDRIVFSPKHPYFKVEPQDKDFAKNNFNLPVPTN